MSLVALAGCFTLQPVSGPAPQAGQQVAFDVNDQGRVALGGTIGPEIGQIEGRIVESDSTSYLLSVAVVRLLRGGEQPWNGEQVRVRQEHLSRAYERRFSAGRTAALGAMGVGGFALFFVTRSLLGAGNNEDPGPCDPTIDPTCGGELRRIRP